MVMFDTGYDKHFFPCIIVNILYTHHFYHMFWFHMGHNVCCGCEIRKNIFLNPFMQKVFSNPYKLDESRTSDCLNEELPIKIVREKFQRNR